jgi:hypothetical protein
VSAVLVTGSKFRVGQDREESTQKIPPGTNNLPREGRSLQHEATKHAKAGDDAELVGMLALPVTRTVRAEASTPSVTCSAVEAEPNPLAPGLPVMSDRIPIWNSLGSKNRLGRRLLAEQEQNVSPKIRAGEDVAVDQDSGRRRRWLDGSILTWPADGLIDGTWKGGGRGRGVREGRYLWPRRGVAGVRLGSRQTLRHLPAGLNTNSELP